MASEQVIAMQCAAILALEIHPFRARCLFTVVGRLLTRVQRLQPRTMSAAEDTEKDTAPVTDASAKKVSKSPWLSAYHNSVAGIKAGSSCMQLVDVYGDGDAKLVVADGDQRLKMYKGARGRCRCARGPHLTPLTSRLVTPWRASGFGSAVSPELLLLG
jgi:hypothetical protein